MRLSILKSYVAEKDHFQISSNMRADHFVWALRTHIRNNYLAQQMFDVILKKHAVQKDSFRIALNVCVLSISFWPFWKRKQVDSLLTQDMIEVILKNNIV